MRDIKEELKVMLLVFGILLCFGIAGHFDYEEAVRTEMPVHEQLAFNDSPQEQEYAVTLSCRTVQSDNRSQVTHVSKDGIVRTRNNGTSEGYTVFQCVKTSEA